MKLRIIALILALVTVLSFAACGGKTPEASTPNQGNTPDTPSEQGSVHKLSEYSVVYSNKINYIATEAVGSLASALADVKGEVTVANIDTITDPVAKEILVGDTNRPESAEALALLTDDTTFVIKTVGEKIVINSKDPNALNIAVNHFLALAKENKFSFDKAIEYVSQPLTKVSIFENGVTKYDINYPADLDDSKSDGSEKRDFEVETAFLLQSKFSTAGAGKLLTKKEGSEKAFLVGYCAAQESVDFRNSLALTEYGFEVVGDKVVISGTNTTTTRLAVDLFVSFIKQQGGTGKFNVSVYDGTRITKRSGGDNWNADIPEFEGGDRFGTLNAGKGAFGVCYENTTAEAFEAYCKKLESLGYTLWQRHDIEDNLHATYTHEDKGMIHTYFTGNEKNVRIISYKKGNYNLPTNPTRGSYENVTKSAVTQYALDRPGGSVGMCYVITLEDGSFIVVDSGTNNDAGNMQKEFYNLLKSLNKRPDGKIIIKAWYITHEHGDHTQAFRAFMRDYGKYVVIEELWCNPASSDYSYHGDSSAFGTAEKNYDTYKSQVNGDLKWINLHTGMEFYAANMKFEVLYTEEDFFPRTLYSGNDTCLVMKMTDMRSGTTMMWLGDTLLRGSNVLSQKYSGYLKADFVQVAHHGKSEALPVYQQILPTVAFLSNTAYSTTAIYRDTNNFLRNNVKTHILSTATYTVYMTDVNGENPIKWNKK